MSFDYNNLPKCDSCPFPAHIGISKLECALHWRPGTGTKFGFPDADGKECPRDSFDASEVTNEDRPDRC